MTPRCYVHPDSRTCLITGHHLHGCTLPACRGCVACETHTPGGAT